MARFRAKLPSLLRRYAHATEEEAYLSGLERFECCPRQALAGSMTVLAYRSQLKDGWLQIPATAAVHPFDAAPGRSRTRSIVMMIDTGAKPSGIDNRIPS